ncbi:hypothetical protein LAZ67_8000571 [Cordylochernes scorpioides]|uniref:PiggyBac transposable element-derived protein domain-containing protein n=1 Tax=Cordylochernes scorpioides TaxID=51811 RepID=A0ABY6KPI3_9ARAC|nr:hypothetical protein LAZ67_8000571 [Cordylochernes scorpioides]
MHTWLSFFDLSGNWVDQITWNKVKNQQRVDIYFKIWGIAMYKLIMRLKGIHVLEDQVDSLKKSNTHYQQLLEKLEGRLMEQTELCKPLQRKLQRKGDQQKDEAKKEFVTNCKTMYRPGEYLTVDEKNIPFKGRCSFKQYLTNKPTYVLCWSRTSYVVNLEIFTGKQPEGPYQISNSPNNVVERLVLPISGSKRNISTDYWYTSYLLAVVLLNEHKLTFVGTLKKNKKEIPPEFMSNRARQVFS